MKKKFLSLFMILAISIFTFIPFIKVDAGSIGFVGSGGNATFTETGTDSEELSNSIDIEGYIEQKKTAFIDALAAKDVNVDINKSNVDPNTLFSTSNPYKYAVVEDIVTGYQMTDSVLTKVYTINYTNVSVTTSAVQYGHNNIWTTSNGKVAVLYENRDSNEQPDLDGAHWVSNGLVVDYVKGDEITVKAKADSGYTFIGWFVSDVQKGADYYYKDKLVSENINYTYKPGVTTVDGIDEPINYLTAAFAEESGIVRKTITVYHTIIEGTFTLTGSDNYSKTYKSGDKNKKEDYILGNIDDDGVSEKIDEYRRDMNEIAADHRTTAEISGEISSYYYEVHDEITQDMTTNKITINTILDKYQVYTLTGTAETKKTTYDLDDERGNKLSFIDYEGIVYVFNSTDILNITDEEIEAIAAELGVDVEVIKKMGIDMIETATKAVEGKGTLIGLYDFSVTDASVSKTTAEGGFNIKIKMNDEMKKYNKFSIACIKDDGTLEDLIELTANGEYLEGVVPHFSTYAIIGNNVEIIPASKGNPNTGDNILFYISLLGISLVGIIAKKRIFN